MPLPLEAVPNFSSAAEDDVAAIGDALAVSAAVLDVHSDADHNRTVFTVAGSGDDLVEALVKAVRVAVERIDLRQHAGVHPRVGAADVVPIVPLSERARDEAHRAARRVAERVGDELGVPVFLYGQLCPEQRLPDGARPAYYRRGGPSELAERVRAGELSPDHGPPTLHGSAGATMVGVRAPLIAFNIELATSDLALAQEIAAEVREVGGGFRGVRALGLALEKTGNVQVSMNVEDWQACGLHDVVAAVESLALARGVDVVGSELVGLMPVGAVIAAAGTALRLPALTSDSLLELRLLEETVTSAERARLAGFDDIAAVSAGGERG